MRTRTNVEGGIWFLSGLIPALATLTALILGLAALFSGGVLPCDIMPAMIIAVLFAASSVYGAVCARRKGSGALTAGAIGGLIMLSLVLTGALMTDGGSVVSPEFLRLSLAALFGGLFGGALRLRRKSRINKNSKKQKRK